MQNNQNINLTSISHWQINSHEIRSLCYEKIFFFLINDPSLSPSPYNQLLREKQLLWSQLGGIQPCGLFLTWNYT